MKKKIILCIVISFVFMWTVFFTTDSIRCKNDKVPIFSLPVAHYKDGGSVHYIGLFYNYYRVSQFNDETKEISFDYVMTPWFCDLDYAQNKVSK